MVESGNAISAGPTPARLTAEIKKCWVCRLWASRPCFDVQDGCTKVPEYIACQQQSRHSDAAHCNQVIATKAESRSSSLQGTALVVCCKKDRPFCRKRESIHLRTWTLCSKGSTLFPLGLLECKVVPSY